MKPFIECDKKKRWWQIPLHDWEWQHSVAGWSDHMRCDRCGLKSWADDNDGGWSV